MDNMLERKLVLGSVIFLLLFSIQKENTGKRIRKKLMRDVKKELATLRNSGISRKIYLKLVTDASTIITRAHAKMVIKSSKGVPMSHVDPAKMLEYMYDKVPVLMSELNLNIADVNELSKYYEESRLGYPSLMFVNRILSELDNYINEMNNVGLESLVLTA